MILFFQAEHGIRDDLVTGVQTCALPIYPPPDVQLLHREHVAHRAEDHEIALAARRPAPDATASRLPQRLDEERVGLRSEERRVGKECRSRGAPEHEREK